MLPCKAGHVGALLLSMSVLLGDGSATARSEDCERGQAHGYYSDQSVPAFPKAFFDINQTDPQMMRDYLSVIDLTYDMLVSKGVPAPKIHFVLSLRGASVAFAANSFGAGNAESTAIGQQIRDLLAKLAGKGVRVEACLISLQWMGVPAEDLPGEIAVIDDAFIATMWYQAEGYALVPVFQP